MWCCSDVEDTNGFGEDDVAKNNFDERDVVKNNFEELTSFVVWQKTKTRPIEKSRVAITFDFLFIL